jgi:hypothetical protein
MEVFKNLKPGQVLSETSFFKVEKVVGDRVQLQAENGESVVLNAGYVDSFLSSGDQFSKEEKVTRTEMADIMMSNARTAMTLSYNKQVKEADVVKEISEAYENSTPKEALNKMKAAVKKGLSGEERVMRGRHYGTKDEFGRTHFIDMDVDRDVSKTYDTRQRLVDSRTLNWLIVNDTKYTIKK